MLIKGAEFSFVNKFKKIHYPKSEVVTWSKVTQKPLLSMGLLALAIAPGIAICIFIYFKDKYNKEPLGLLLMSFIMGMLAIIPAVIIQIFLTRPVEQLMG